MDLKLIVLFLLIGATIGLSHINRKNITKLKRELGRRWLSVLSRWPKSKTLRSQVDLSTWKLELATRALIAGIAVALLTIGADAQAISGEKGKKHQRDTQKTEDRAKKKVDEKAYDDALKSIPASHEKPDPWKSMR